MLKNVKDQIKYRTILWKMRQRAKCSLLLMHILKDETVKTALRKQQPTEIHLSECYDALVNICGRRYTEKNKKFFDDFNQKYLAYISE